MPAQIAADFLVQRGDAGARIDHEQRHVGAFQRCFGLHPHPAGQAGGIFVFPPGGVDDGEFKAQQRRIAKATVTGDAGLVVNQRQLLADEPVEQSGLAHVGPSDDDNLGTHSPRWPGLAPKASGRCITLPRRRQL